MSLAQVRLHILFPEHCYNVSLTLVVPEERLKFVQYFLESLTKPAVAGAGLATADFLRNTEESWR